MYFLTRSKIEGKANYIYHTKGLLVTNLYEAKNGDARHAGAASQIERALLKSKQMLT